VGAASGRFCGVAGPGRGPAGPTETVPGARLLLAVDELHGCPPGRDVVVVADADDDQAAAAVSHGGEGALRLVGVAVEVLLVVEVGVLADAPGDEALEVLLGDVVEGAPSTSTRRSEQPAGIWGGMPPTLGDCVAIPSGQPSRPCQGRSIRSNVIGRDRSASPDVGRAVARAADPPVRFRGRLALACHERLVIGERLIETRQNRCAPGSGIRRKR
jgi:hypothetical protein